MKKESNGIGENKNSKKISKNNKIISSVLVVIMCCQSFVGANPNSDNSGFVPYEGINNNLAADGSEEEDKEEKEKEKKEEEKEVKDIESKENNSSGLIRNSSNLIRNGLGCGLLSILFLAFFATDVIRDNLDGILFLAAAVSLWFYGTKNKDLKSKNEEIERLKKEFKEKDEELNEKNRRLKVNYFENNSKEYDFSELSFLDYFGWKAFTFALGKKTVVRKNEEDEGVTFFYSLDETFGDVSSILYGANDYLFAKVNEGRLPPFCYNFTHLLHQLSPQPQLSPQEVREEEIKTKVNEMDPYSQFVYRVITDENYVSGLTRKVLRKELCRLLSDCEPEFRLTSFYLILKNKSKEVIGNVLVSEELAELFIEQIKKKMGRKKMKAR
ncbi:MAG: hypothetical protein CfP315_0012 [Candidatus Improbicoccus pseudotrichonymphae]|uniref:Uncharacterized protein n=1 Tax=Candidatus Improbicoccus pseudotrichonymphae TaxID=3033792 RepID=A0AA48I3P5_9FIRM|nr:MAG: hypothetical protein CfP315_0012 [Candidatus Improbicoccus pseudotrichonymphae]